MSNRYDDPNATIRREAMGMAEAGGGASTEYAKFISFQKMKLKNVHAVVTVAGTADAHAVTVLNGATIIGTMTLGTSAKGATVSLGAVNSAVAALGQVSVKTLLDVVGKAIIVYEYAVDYDAVQS